jgi:hypothetical protein
MQCDIVKGIIGGCLCCAGEGARHGSLKVVECFGLAVVSGRLCGIAGSEYHQSQKGHKVNSHLFSGKIGISGRIAIWPESSEKRWQRKKPF